MGSKSGRITLIVLVAFGVGAQHARAEREWDVPTDPSKFHIFIFEGQSNMAGGFKESHLYDDDSKGERSA